MSATTKTATCASCGQKIIWIRDQDGTRHPVNRRRVRVYYGHPESREHWKYQVDGVGKPELYHISHFVTCPHAREHSKG